jgi:hypothetical protein
VAVSAARRDEQEPSTIPGGVGSGGGADVAQHLERGSRSAAVRARLTTMRPPRRCRGTPARRARRVYEQGVVSRASRRRLMRRSLLHRVTVCLQAPACSKASPRTASAPLRVSSPRPPPRARGRSLTTWRYSSRVTRQGRGSGRSAWRPTRGGAGHRRAVPATRAGLGFEELQRLLGLAAPTRQAQVRSGRCASGRRRFQGRLNGPAKASVVVQAGQRGGVEDSRGA